jgi:hypothetical protein
MITRNYHKKNTKKSNIKYVYLILPLVKLTRSCMVVLFLLEIFVEGVALEYLLDCALSQKDSILFYEICHLFVLLCWLVTDVVRVVLTVRPERRLEVSLGELRPRKVSQPCMGS